MSSARGHIARAHSKRRIRARRARSLLLALAIILSSGLAISSFAGFDGASVASAAIEKAKSFLQLMHHRSPGIRTKGMLIKTKHKHVIAHERALPKVQVAMPAILPAVYQPEMVDILAPPIKPVPASFETIPIPPILQTPPPPGVPLIPPLIVPPTETPPIVTPPTALPEPDAWVMMLLGFGLLGWRLRRSPARRAAAI